MGVISSKSTVKHAKKIPPNGRSSDSVQTLDLETVHLTEEITGVETLNLKPNEVKSNIDTDKPITESEKLLHLYKKEQSHGTSEESSVTKKDVGEDNRGRQQYRTSGFHDTGRQVNSLTTEDNEDVQKLDENESRPDGSKVPEITDLETSTDATTHSPVKSPAKLSPVINGTTSMLRENDGSLLSYSLTQHCPSLLEQSAKNVDGSLRPLALTKLEVDKNQIRTELEKQGILTKDALTSVDDIDPKQEGIIGELRHVGIIQKVTSTDDAYLMSSGLPKRRPPPRLAQLPLTDKDLARSSDDLFRKFSSIDKVLLSKETEVSTEAPPADADQGNSEYFTTLGTETIGDAETLKLKVKLIDVDIL